MIQTVPVVPAVLSIIGWHACESPADIVRRKRADIVKGGYTIWFYQSWKARVQDVQSLGSLHSNPTVYFLDGGAVPAGTSKEAKEMSPNGSNWQVLPKGLSKVTGKLPGAGLFVEDLSAVADREIDLWEYFEHPASTPLKFQQGASTACVVPAPSGPVHGMKSRKRRIVAVGRLTTPYAVFLR